MNNMEFRRRVDHNTSVLKKALLDGKSIISVIQDFYTLTSKPGDLHHMEIALNYMDIAPSVYLGFLPSLNASGADAVQILPNNQKVYWELKTSTINGMLVKLGSKGGLYLQKDENNPKSRISVLSYLRAKYNISSDENLASKNRKTAMLIADKDFPQFDFIDAWCMKGNDVVDIISGNSGQIKFSVFKNKGEQMKPVVDLPGYDKWCQVITTNLSR